MPARSTARAAYGRPSASPRRSQSPASAASTSPRLQRSPRTTLLSHGTYDHQQPRQPHGPEDHSNRVAPSLLASNPSQHLESDPQTLGNPKSIQNYRITLYRIGNHATATKHPERFYPRGLLFLGTA